MMCWQESYEFDGEDSDLETACLNRMVYQVSGRILMPKRDGGLALSRLEQKYRRSFSGAYSLYDFWFDEGVLQDLHKAIEEKMPQYPPRPRRNWR